MDNVSVVVGRNSMVFGVPRPEGILTVPCKRVRPDGVELVLKIVLGNSLSAKPAPNSITAIDNTTMAILYALWLWD